MTDQLTIRRARNTELDELIALYLHLDPNDRLPSLQTAEQNFAALANIAGSGVLVGLVGNAIVSSCTLIVVPNLTRGGQPYGLIENVVTDAKYRGRGFGKLILKAAVQQAWDAGCYKVMLMTGSKKPSTLAFYAAAGFEQNKTGFQVRRLPVRQDTD